jgi:hypothetical protein
MAKVKRTPAKRGGWPSIFRDKDGGDRVQGVITPIGARSFEVARARLAKLASREVEQISDADVIEYLARGEAATMKYLEGRAD